MRDFLSRFARSVSRRASANRPAARLRLEALEERTTPTTFNVTTTLDVVSPTDGKRSLREAITQANTSAGADVIVLPVGVFKITLAGSEDGNANGDFDITGSVTIQGAGAGKTVIDGQQLDRVFDVNGTDPSPIKVVFQGLTIRNGNLAAGEGGGIRGLTADLVFRDCAVVGNRAAGDGGGIFANVGSRDVTLVRTTVARNIAGGNGGAIGMGPTADVFTATDCIVRRNSAALSGGGVWANTATLNGTTVTGNSAAGEGGGVWANASTLIGCTINENTARVNGGGVFAAAAELTNCTISGNFVPGDGTGVGSGGGIRAGTAVLTNCTVSGNTAVSTGGGIRANTATLTNCTVRGNFVPGAGPGTGNGGGIYALTAATLTGCTVKGNTAAVNGGGMLAAGTVTLTNCTLSGNTAYADGGGMIAITATMLNCTIVENLAANGGGLYHFTGGTFTIKNTIVALNQVRFGGSGPDVAGNDTFTSLGHNLIGDGTGSMGFGINFDIVGTAANPIDPKIGALRNNGGRTMTHALLAGSPAIDNGDNAGAPASDQRGLPRRKDGNGDGVATVDIGAFETP